MGDSRNHLQLSNTVYLVFFLFIFFIPVDARVDFIVDRVGPKCSVSDSNGAIGPLRDTIKFTVAATWIEKWKSLKKPYSYA